MKKKTILLVDDDEVVRDMIKEALETKYAVVEASRHSEAVEKMGPLIDLAIIDFVLPDGDGLDVLEAVRKHRQTLPAIIMTAYGHESVAIRAVRAGVTDYIKKPLGLSYLLRRVSEILGDKEKDEIEFEEPRSREDFIMDGIALHLERKYMENLQLNDLYLMAGMCKTKFCRLFNKRFGQSCMAYLNTIRVRNAEELLKNPHLTITEIAHFVGFRSLSQFHRIFRKTSGISPLEYRRSYDMNR